MKITYLLMAFSMLLSVTSNALAAEKKDIVDTAVAAGNFKTLAAALQAAGLVDTLKGPGPFTVFAPTDEAFAKLPAGTVEELLKPENKDKLVAILTYHVVPGKVMAKDVMKLNSAKTVNGKSVTISDRNGAVMVDNARVVQTDIACFERSHSRDRFRNSAAIGWWYASAPTAGRNISQPFFQPAGSPPRSRCEFPFPNSQISILTTSTLTRSYDSFSTRRPVSPTNGETRSTLKQMPSPRGG